MGGFRSRLGCTPQLHISRRHLMRARAPTLFFMWYDFVQHLFTIWPKGGDRKRGGVRDGSVGVTHLTVVTRAVSLCVCIQFQLAAQYFSSPLFASIYWCQDARLYRKEILIFWRCLFLLVDCNIWVIFGSPCFWLKTNLKNKNDVLIKKEPVFVFPLRLNLFRRQLYSKSRVACRAKVIPSENEIELRHRKKTRLRLDYRLWWFRFILRYAPRGYFYRVTIFARSACWTTFPID